MACLLLILTSCGDRPSEPHKAVPSARQPAGAQQTRVLQAPPVVQSRIQVEPVTMRNIEELVTAPGEVAVDLARVAKVTSRIDGQVEQVFVRLGDRVRRGQPLLAVGSLRLDELVQDYLVSKAQAEVAENSFRRTEKLRAENIVSERRFVEERGRHIETKARFQHVREKLLNMGLSTAELRELEQGSHLEGHRYTLRAPLSGSVVNQNVVLGQGVAPGMDLFEVIDTGQVWVFANLPIEQARRFKEGDQGTIVPKEGEPLTAPLTYLAPVADERTRTIRVRFDVPNPEGRLKPHEYVDVRLPIQGSPTLAVPLSAVTLVGKVHGVFVQQDTGYLFVPIESGREGGGWVEAKAGLNPGDRVVTQGVFDLKNVLLKDAIQSGDGG